MSESNDKLQFQRGFDELQSDYANNVAFESTVWDLKLLFGEYSDRLKGVEWHTSITVPWAQSKLMLYYLTLNIRFHELQGGQGINIPPGMTPKKPEPPLDPNDASSAAIYDMIKRAHDALFGPDSKK